MIFLKTRVVDVRLNVRHLPEIYHVISLEKFFEMKKGQCKDALEIYKRFLTRMTRVSEFLKVAEVSGFQSSGVWHLSTL